MLNYIKFKVFNLFNERKGKVTIIYYFAGFLASSDFPYVLDSLCCAEHCRDIWAGTGNQPLLGIWEHIIGHFV